MLNHIVLIGRLTKDPELRYTNNGTAVASFTLAVNRFKKDEADFINIVAWKAQAENCAQYLTKGSQVAVEGRLQIRSYEDKEQKRRTVAEVVANSVQFLDTKNKQSTDAASYAQNEMGGIEVGEEDIPF